MVVLRVRVGMRRGRYGVAYASVGIPRRFTRRWPLSVVNTRTSRNIPPVY